jgi:chemotaxis protein methyltransferase CheR
MGKASFDGLKRTYRELPLSSKTFRLLVDLVYQHSRIRFGDEKLTLFSNRLRARVLSLGLDSFEAYVNLLQSDKTLNEIEELLDLVSTNHTRFFREETHFEYLRKSIIPELIPRLKSEAEQLNIWSAACSSGEEPYSIAITCSEALMTQSKLKYRVIGSDISNRVLSIARRGVYRLEASKYIAPHVLKNYFQKGVDDQSGLIRVIPELKKRVTFERLNLFDIKSAIAEKQHVIFCRNVMIYFDVKSRAEVVKALIKNLHPKGYLIIGISESLLEIEQGLTAIKQGIYQKL